MQLPDESHAARRRDVVQLALAIALVCSVVVGAHWPALTARAYSFDDVEYLFENELVRNPSWDSARRFLTEVLHPSTVSGYYQPLSMISLMLDCAAGGSAENLAPFHRTSLALHTLNVALLLLLFYALFRSVWAAAAVALLFGVHPLTVEPIPWVSERKTLLATFFALGFLLAYVQYVRRKSYWAYGAALLLYVLSLLSKPTSTTLPVALLALDWWPLRRLSWRAVLEKVPFLLIAAGSALITLISQQQAAGVIAPAQTGLVAVVLKICHNIVFYLYLLVWPVNLSWHYPVPQPLTLADPFVLAGVIGTPLLIAGLLIAWRWTRAPLASWLFFFVAILPTLGIVGFTYFIAGLKYLYLPSIGLFMLLVPAVVWLWRRGNATRRVTFGRMVVVVLLAAATSAEAYYTRRDLGYWQDTELLHRRMLEIRPNAWAARFNLANYLRKQGRFDEAMDEYARVVEQMPEHWKARSNLGNGLLLRGEALLNARQPADARAVFERALAQLDEALRYAPRSVPTIYNRGRALLALGRPREALAAFESALAIDPNLGPARQQCDRLREYFRNQPPP